MIDRITLLSTLYNGNCISSSSLKDLYELILEDKSVIRNITNDIKRNIRFPKEQDRLKKTLPIVMFNGLFNKRNNNSLVE